MLADRISAVILKDKKILLVSDDSSVYWTPGGKLDPGESHIQAIDRELYEELKSKSTSAKQYLSYNAFHEIKKDMQTVYCYLVTITGDIIPSAEITKYGWYSKENLPRLMISIKDNLIPKLIEDKLL
jgi:8-oxo-dGTP diphosphatase